MVYSISLHVVATRPGADEPSTSMTFDVSDLGMPPALADWLRVGEWRWQRPS
jgi:hypothetical protein